MNLKACALDLAEVVRATGASNGQSWQIAPAELESVLARHLAEPVPPVEVEPAPLQFDLDLEEPENATE